MAKRLIYVGQDDDLSDLAGKVQAADPGDEIALAVPAGAQAFQTPLNVRLLRSVAMKRGLTTTIVSPDPRIQEVAQSAGLVVYSSVAALEGGVAVEQPRPDFRPAGPPPRPQAPFLPGPPPAPGLGGAGSAPPVPFEYAPRPGAASSPGVPGMAPPPSGGAPVPPAGGATAPGSGATLPGAVPAPRTGPWGAPITSPWPPVPPEPVLPAVLQSGDFVPLPSRAPFLPASSPPAPTRAPILPASPVGPAPRQGNPWSPVSGIPVDDEPLSPWAGARAALAPSPVSGGIGAPPAPPPVPVVPPPSPRTGSTGRRPPGAPPPPSLAGRLRLPSRRVIYGIVVGALALGIVLFLLLSPSATVTITVAETPLTVTPTIQGTTSTAQAAQPNYILSKQITDTASQTFQASPTGTQAVPGVAASGFVQLTIPPGGSSGACIPGDDLTVYPDSLFDTSGSTPIVFSVTATTQVICATSGPTIFPSVPVTASATGTSGNVPPGAIDNCPSIEGWCQTWQITNIAATTGGVNASAEAVASASDIANWQEQLGQVETQMGETANSDLSAKAGQDKVALDPSGGGKSITYVVSPSTFPPATAGTVMTAETVTVTMTAQETVYNPADIDAVVLKDLEASTNLPSGDALVTSQLQLNNLQVIQAGSDGTFALSVSAVDYYHGSENLSQLAGQLAGHSPGSVQGIVEGAIPNVQNVTVDETPIQFLFMPFSSSSIHVVETFVTSSQSASTVTG